MNILFISFLALISSSVASLAAGPDDWQKEKESENVILYSRLNNEMHRKEFKAVSIIDSKLGELSAILLDIENRPRWFPDCSSVEIINKKGPGNFIYHLKVDSPFPVEDRDMVQEMNTIPDPSKGIVTISYTTLPEYLPEEEGYIRVNFSEGIWILKKINDKQVAVEHRFITDPGGNVPQGLYDVALKNRVFDIFEKIVKECEEDRYKNGLDWIQG